jgi:hypothetical protein
MHSKKKKNEGQEVRQVFSGGGYQLAGVGIRKGGMRVNVVDGFYIQI